MKRVLLDANVLIRFLRADHAEHFAKAQKLFAEAERGTVQLVLLDAVLAECVFVLTSVYKVKRDALAAVITPILFHDGIECSSATVLADALDRFSRYNVDFLDSYLAAQAKALQIPVSSFD